MSWGAGFPEQKEGAEFQQPIREKGRVCPGLRVGIRKKGVGVYGVPAALLWFALCFISKSLRLSSALQFKITWRP